MKWIYFLAVIANLSQTFLQAKDQNEEFDINLQQSILNFGDSSVSVENSISSNDIIIDQSNDDQLIINENQPIKFRHSRDKNFQLPDKFTKAIGPIIAADEFFISVDLRQKSRNHGTFFRLSDSQDGALLIELLADARKRRVKLRYSKSSSNKASMGHISVKFDLSSGTHLHKLRIQFSANQGIRISIDCGKGFAGDFTKLHLGSSIYDLAPFGYLGQRNRYDSYFVGEMQSFKIGKGKLADNLDACPTSTPIQDTPIPSTPPQDTPIPLIPSTTERTEGTLQKPKDTTNCPGCLKALNIKLNHLMNEMTEIRDRVDHFEHRVKGVQLVQRGCVFEGVQYDHGANLRNDSTCTECSCTEGAMYCRPFGCPRVHCNNPELPHDGACCPVCKQSCQYMGARYEHGEVFWPNKGKQKQCVRCECSDSDTTCRFERPHDCPTLKCPTANQVIPPGQCCPMCKLGDYCKETPCHVNATCHNSNYTRECKCKEGFFGDGIKSCYDIDECKIDPDISAQLGGCGLGARCVNTPGSFRCECLTGFVQIDRRNCLDILLYK